MLKIIKKFVKFIIDFIVDFWFIHLLELIWLAPTIYILIVRPESAAVRILIAVSFFLCGMMEGCLLYLEIDD